MTSNRATDQDGRQSPIRVSAAGLIVRKIPSLRGEEAVVVDLTLRSGLDEQRQVRIEDRIPDPLIDSTVEFHPQYDPQRWTREADRVVYEAPIGPGIVRRTVWGILVDDPDQLDLFMTRPEVRLVEPTPDSTETMAPPDAFDFGETPPDQPESGRRRQLSSESEASVVSALVEELRDRELSRSERAVLRSALDLDVLRSEVESLHASTDALSDDVGSVQSTLKREVAWREQLRRLLAADPDED